MFSRSLSAIRESRFSILFKREDIKSRNQTDLFPNFSVTPSWSILAAMTLSASETKKTDAEPLFPEFGPSDLNSGRGWTPAALLIDDPPWF